MVDKDVTEMQSFTQRWQYHAIRLVRDCVVKALGAVGKMCINLDEAPNGVSVKIVFGEYTAATVINALATMEFFFRPPKEGRRCLCIRERRRRIGFDGRVRREKRSTAKKRNVDLIKT